MKFSDGGQMLQSFSLCWWKSVLGWVPALQVFAVFDRLFSLRQVDLHTVSGRCAESVPVVGVGDCVYHAVCGQCKSLFHPLCLVHHPSRHIPAHRSSLDFPLSVLSSSRPSSRLLQYVCARHGPLPPGLLFLVNRRKWYLDSLSS